MAEDSFKRATQMIIKLQDENAQLKYALLENKYIQEKGFKFNEQDMFEFAYWYCNGLLNVERKTPEEMYPKYIKIRQEIIKNK